MSMSNIRFVACCLLAVFTGSVAYAQPAPSVLFGPSIGISAAADAASVPVYQSSAECGTFEKGLTFGASFGGRLMFPSLFGDRLGMSVRAAGAYASMVLTTDPVDPTRLLDDGVLLEIDRDLVLSDKRWSGALDVLLRYRLGDRLALSFGPSAAFAFASEITQADRIVSPDGFRFANDASERPIANATDVTAASLTAGGTLLASYEIPVGSALLVPSLGVRADILSSVKTYGWRRFGLGAEIDYLFDITPSPDPPPPPPEPVVEPPAKVPVLAAAVRMVSLDKDGNEAATARVRVDEVFFRKHTPLLPVVFFEKDSVSFPSRYVTSDRQSAEAFALPQLAERGVLDIQRNVLDIVGSRMRMNPESKITLIGLTSRDESPAIGRARADAVRQYLESTWGIAQPRVEIRERGGSLRRSTEATEDGRADNRRVEIVASSRAVLAPVSIERVERSFDPPAVRVDHKIDAEAGIRSLALRVRQGDNVIAEYNERDSVALRDLRLEWKLASPPIDSALTPLTAELTVVDATGASTTARDARTFTVEKRSRIVDGRVVRDGDLERSSYTLVGFDYNSAVVDPLNEAALREVAAAVQDGATIKVTGYTDRIGLEERNAALSAERAESAARLLRAFIAERNVRADVAAAGAGVDTERFGNDSPEGRLLSRGLTVVIEQVVGSRR